MSAGSFLSQGQLALQNTISKAIQVCCTTIFFYYSALNFNEELEYTWSKKWTSGKALYLLTRYSGGVFLIYVTATTFGLAWGDTGLLRFTSEWDLYDTWLEICLYGYLYVGPGTIIMLFAEIILQMRVYALYGRTKKMLALLILLTFVLLGFDVIQPLGFPYEAEESICLGGPCKTFGSRKRNLYNQSAGLPCTTLSLPISAIGWLLNSLMELLLFILVLRKCRQAKRHDIVQTSSQTGHRVPQNCDIITIMARDSTAYFAVIFTVCLVGTLLAFATEIRIADNHIMDFISSQMSTYQTVALTVMTILAPKLLINLRGEYYGPVGAFSDWEKTQMTWNVAVPRHEVDRTLQEPNDSDLRTTLLGTHNRSESETVDLRPQFPNYSDYDSPHGRSSAV